MKNYFQGNSSHPEHLSVGAVLVNERGEICVHHFSGTEAGYWGEQGLKDFYLLMRRTLNPNESLEEALARGLLEEFGATAEVQDYIGSHQSSFTHNNIEVKKTTVYFLCKLVNQDLNKRKTDEPDGLSKIEWQTKEFLIPKMKEQSKKYNRTDMDESSILEKIK